MSFRVIEGGGERPTLVAGTVQAARAAVLDRVAAAIYAAHDPFPDPAYATWAELKALAETEADRARLVRSFQAQARFAIQALRPADHPADADIEIAVEAWAGSFIDGVPSMCLTDVQGWLDEVLK